MSTDIVRTVNALEDLVITRVDVVDLGGNQDADICLFKRRVVKGGGSGDSCPECGGYVSTDDATCPSCGEKVKKNRVADHGTDNRNATGTHDLDATCPSCGASIKGDDQKCPECGADVGPIAKYRVTRCGPGECVWCDGRVEKKELKAKTRDALEDSDFAAVYTDASGDKQRKLPIYDEAHVRNALARFSSTDLPADKRASAKAKIDAAAKKFGIGADDEGVKKIMQHIQKSPPDGETGAAAKKPPTVANQDDGEAVPPGGGRAPKKTKKPMTPVSKIAIIQAGETEPVDIEKVAASSVHVDSAIGAPSNGTPAADAEGKPPKKKTPATPVSKGGKASTGEGGDEEDDEDDDDDDDGQGKTKKRRVLKMASDAGPVEVIVVSADEDDDDDPDTFGDLLVDRAAKGKLWELYWALCDSVQAILYCDDLTAGEKQSSIAQSGEEFVAAVEQLVPTEVGDVLKRLKEAVMADGKVTLDMNAIPEAQRGAVEAVVKSLSLLTAENAELKKRLPAETEDERVRKALPESVRKRMDLQDEEIRKMREAGEVEAEIKKLRTLPLRNTTAETFGPVLYRIRKNRSTEADLTELERILKAYGEQALAAERLANASRGAGARPTGLTGTSGVDGSGSSSGGGSAVEEIESLAKKLQGESPKDFGLIQKARAEIRKRHPELAKREREENYGRQAS